MSSQGDTLYEIKPGKERERNKKVPVCALIPNHHHQIQNYSFCCFITTDPATEQHKTVKIIKSAVIIKGKKRCTS